MTKPSTSLSQWAVVDEGWGRKAVDFATLSEPATAGSTPLCTIGWALMPGTGCSTWHAGPGSQSSWHACAALPLRY
jgi:hypothetical protein